MSVVANRESIPEGMRPVYAVPRGVEAYHVMRFMAARGTRAVVVLGGLKPIGIVTAHDLADRVPGGGLSETMTKVESAMSSPLIKIGEWGGVVEAIAMMSQKGITYLPIVSANGYLVSSITLAEAQQLRGQGVPALREFVRTSVIVSMARRTLWSRAVYGIRRRIRKNRVWWLIAAGLALAGAALALSIGQNWHRIQTYGPQDYEPKDLSRQQHEEQKQRSQQTDAMPGAR